MSTVEKKTNLVWLIKTYCCKSNTIHLTCKATNQLTQMLLQLDVTGNYTADSWKLRDNFLTFENMCPQFNLGWLQQPCTFKCIWLCIFLLRDSLFIIIINHHYYLDYQRKQLYFLKLRVKHISSYKKSRCFTIKKRCKK